MTMAAANDPIAAEAQAGLDLALPHTAGDCR